MNSKENILNKYFEENILNTYFLAISTIFRYINTTYFDININYDNTILCSDSNSENPTYVISFHFNNNNQFHYYTILTCTTSKNSASYSFAGGKLHVVYSPSELQTSLLKLLKSLEFKNKMMELSLLYELSL